MYLQWQLFQTLLWISIELLCKFITWELWTKLFIYLRWNEYAFYGSAATGTPPYPSSNMQYSVWHPCMFLGISLDYVTHNICPCRFMINTVDTNINMFCMVKSKELWKIKHYKYSGSNSMSYITQALKIICHLVFLLIMVRSFILILDITKICTLAYVGIFQVSSYSKYATLQYVWLKPFAVISFVRKSVLQNQIGKEINCGRVHVSTPSGQDVNLTNIVIWVVTGPCVMLTVIVSKARVDRTTWSYE